MYLYLGYGDPQALCVILRMMNPFNRFNSKAPDSVTAIEIVKPSKQTKAKPNNGGV